MQRTFSLFVLVSVCLVAWAESIQPPGVELPANRRLGTVPDGFMLMLSDPGCDPEEECDDVGPPKAYRNWYLDQTLVNVGDIGYSWAATEKTEPATGEAPVYDFSDIRPDERFARMKFKIAHIGCGGVNWIGNPREGIGPAWVERDAFKFDIDADGRKVVSARYWKRFEDWVEAACRDARERFGCTLFMTGGNERDLIARDVYKDYYPDWHFYYMAPIKPIHAGMKRAHPDNRLIIGNLCYTSYQHMDALYAAGAKGNFEILAIHNYGPAGAHLDMKQILWAREGLVQRGDDHVGIILTEGWSCFPLPPHIDHDPANRQPGGRTYTAEDCEHYRQTVLDGWRNLMTPREGEYDPSWVIGANYFVLNDHWGGRLWEQRAFAVFDLSGDAPEPAAPSGQVHLRQEKDGVRTYEIPALDYHGQGTLRGFKIDGYDIGTGDPLWIKPLLRPWGLIKQDGTPKGDIVFNFPPYLPQHSFTARITDPLEPDKRVVAEREYSVTVTFTNEEASPMTDFRLAMIGRDEFAEKIRFRNLDGDSVTTLAPGQSITRRFVAIYPESLVGLEDRGRPRPVRGYADAHYTWEGRPYHSDAWMPNVVVIRSDALRR